MVVLAAAVVTKGGKALVSRQYVQMTRVRVEGLLAAFPKLVGNGKQHTYVETENVRYVYQPLECGTMYLLLVTTKGSNILEDLDVLRLLAKTLPEYTQGQVDEEGVSYAAFDLIFAFDEIISLGHKENVTMAQVKTFTEMNSHEEKLHKMMIQSKINDTKDIMRRKATEIDKVKLEQKMQQHAAHRSGGGGFGGANQAFGARDSYGGSGGGFGGSQRGGFGDMGGFEDGSNDEFGYLGRGEPMSGGYGGDDRPGGGFRTKYSADTGAYGQQSPGMPQKSLAGPKKGMQLGGKPKTNQFLESLRAEGEISDVDVVETSRDAAPSAPAPIATPAESVDLVIEEKLNVSLDRNGGLEQMEVQGNMMLEVRNEDDALIRVMTRAGENKGFQFKTHPNIDKGLHANEKILGLKDPNRPFPCGSALGVLKWRFSTKDESSLPLSINCWPSINGNETSVSIEYEAADTMDLQHVVITIPCPPCRDPPVVSSCDGDFRFDARSGVMEWNIELIDDSNRNGSMEFVVPTANTDAFFPIDVHFSAATTMCDIDVTSISRTTDGAPVTFSGKKMLHVDSYQVV